MAFQLKAKESMSDGIKRNVTRELEKVLHYLAPSVGSRKGESDGEAVHEIRKCFKKVRAALRLVRDDIGDEFYHEKNFCFRDTARPLTSVRDADVLLETLEKLHQEFTNQIDPTSLEKVRDALLRSQQEISNRILKKDRAFARVKEVTTREIDRLSSWQIQGNGWEGVESGLKRVYRLGHRALATATENPSVANLHEWRKQAKYLWHVLQLIEFSWTKAETDLGDQVHELTQILGQDHDLAVLRETLAADPLAYGGHPFLKKLFALIDGNRKKLEKQAFVLGRRLYKDPAKTFIARMESYWKANSPEIKTLARPVRSRAVPRSQGASKQKDLS